jgi:rhodanese-related sulfurtransferase
MIRFTILFLFFLVSCELYDKKQIILISDSQLLEILDNDHILVDVRTPEEYDSGYIQNAVNYDYYSESFVNEILSLEKNSSIILYCRTNNRSTKTANFLQENGYEKIFVLRDGITEWVKNDNDLTYTSPK